MCVMRRARAACPAPPAPARFATLLAPVSTPLPMDAFPIPLDSLRPPSHPRERAPRPEERARGTPPPQPPRTQHPLLGRGRAADREKADFGALGTDGGARWRVWKRIAPGPKVGERRRAEIRRAHRCRRRERVEKRTDPHLSRALPPEAAEPNCAFRSDSIVLSAENGNTVYTNLPPTPLPTQACQCLHPDRSVFRAAGEGDPQMMDESTDPRQPTSSGARDQNPMQFDHSE